jgi:hypothetical protein
MSNLPIRPDLAAKKPYGAPQLNVEVKLNTNENPFSHDEAFVSEVSAKLQEVLRNANRYPDPEALELRARLAAYLTVTTATILMQINYGQQTEVMRFCSSCFSYLVDRAGQLLVLNHHIQCTQSSRR